MSDNIKMESKSRVWDENKVKNILREKGYEIISPFTLSRQFHDLIDQDGYKYYYKPYYIIYNNKIPPKFKKTNPYTIENLKLYISLNNLGCELLSNKYTGGNDKLLWKCQCGRTFEASETEFVTAGKTTCNYCSYSISNSKSRDVKEVQKLFEERGYILLNSSIPKSTDYLFYICTKHSNEGQQKITWYSFKNGKGCKFCGIEKAAPKRRIPEERIRSITESKGFIFCGIEYSLDTPGLEHSLVKYKCPIHTDKGVFKMNISYINKSSGK